MRKIEQGIFDTINSAIITIEQGSHQVAEMLEVPNFEKLTSLAKDYRRNANKASLKEFIKKIESRSPKYLKGLIDHNRGDTESITAIANCISQIYDEAISPEELLDL